MDENTLMKMLPNSEYEKLIDQNKKMTDLLLFYHGNLGSDELIENFNEEAAEILGGEDV